MTKYFFEYLLERQMVDKAKVIDAFVQQAKSIPSQLEILKESNFFSEEELLNIITLQIDEKSSPFEIIQKYSLLNSDKLDSIQQMFQDKVRSLGSILIEQNILEQKNYFKALHKFCTTRERLSDDGVIVPMEESRDVSTQSSDESSDESSEVNRHEENFINQAALDSLKELVEAGNVDENILDDLNPEQSNESNVAEDDEIDNIVNPAALDSLKELVGTGTVDESVLMELGDEPGVTEAENEETSGDNSINQAALDSLKELVGTGGLDESVLAELDNENSKEEVNSSEDEGEVSQAALESLKELVGSGGVDASVLDELMPDQSSVLSENPLDGFNGELLADDIFIENLLRVYNLKTHEKLNKLNILIGDAIVGGDYPLNLVNKFLGELRVIKGGFFSVGAKPISELLTVIENRILVLNEEFEKNIFVSFSWSEHFDGVAPFFKRILQIVEENKSLKILVESEELKKEFCAIYKRFKSEV